jgi:hypothetical protein
MKNELLAGIAASNFTLGRNLDGITHEESLHQPGGKGNCINWIAGHILQVRDQFLSGFGVEKFLTDDEYKLYSQGSSPVTCDENCMQLSRIKEGLEKTYITYRDFISKQDDNFFKTPLPAEAFPFEITEPDLGKMITVLLYPEGYHTGQIGLIKRILSKDFDNKI